LCDTELSHDTNLYSTGITVSLQSVAPVSEPGNDGNTTVDVCVTVEGTPGPIDRVGNIVITFNTLSGTAGTLSLKYYNTHIDASPLFISLVYYDSIS